MQLDFIPGIPVVDGFYFVKLIPGTLSQFGPVGDQPYGVDYCRAKSPSDGGGREWVKWYEHNISHYAVIPIVL